MVQILWFFTYVPSYYSIYRIIRWKTDCVCVCVYVEVDMNS